MKTVAVIFGGRSAEHEVSIVTAHIPVIAALQALGHRVVPVYIAEDGRWYSDPGMNELSYFKAAGWRSRLSKLKPLELGVGDGLSLVWPGLRAKRQKIDVVFPTMHGTFGEDGSLMGLLRMANVPFVGCDMAASAVAMDKVLTKQVAAAANIPSVKWDWFSKSDFETDRAAVLARFKDYTYPLFVKPPHLGSSIAITKVEKASELANAIEVALHYDDKAMVEEGVHNLVEVTVPIMLDEKEVWLGKVERPNAEFFDFETKYIGGGGKKGGKTDGVNSAYSEIPAKLEPKLYKACEDMAVATARALGLYGISRIDLLIDSKNNQVYMNEVNTLPGSLYHHNWKVAGYSNTELVQKLLDLAEQRFKQQQAQTFVFSSDILKVV